MRWINLGRRNGKTAMMITASFVTGMPIIVSDQCQRDIVMKQAKDMGLEIGVYTLSEFSRYKSGLTYTQKVLIDEAQKMMEQALEERIGCEVVAVTTSIPMIQKEQQEGEMIDCYKNCKDLRNGVCPPMKMFCPKKLAEHDKQIRADAIAELKSLLRCRNYRGSAAGKGCDGVCSIDSDICRSCEDFGIPYSLLEQMQKGAE